MIILCTHDVRCVLNTSTRVQVTVTEKDRAIIEMERTKEGAVREKEEAIQRLQVCSWHTLHNVSSRNLAQAPMGVYSEAPHRVRCVHNISAHVQVTVSEKDRAIQEMEREKERAVEEKPNVIQQKERVIREKEQLIQTLLVCAYMYNVRLILRSWEVAGGWG